MCVPSEAEYKSNGKFDLPITMRLGVGVGRAGRIQNCSSVTDCTCVTSALSHRYFDVISGKDSLVGIGWTKRVQFPGREGKGRDF
jgi:hypothetical protein